MEAIRKIQPKTVMDMLAGFKATYPRDKFIWVNSPLETCGAWPEHYGLGARTFKVPTDNLIKSVSKSGKESSSNGWIYLGRGNVYGLHATAKRQIMNDAGVTFEHKQMRHLDDGTNPKVCGLEGVAAILGLGEMRMVTGSYWVDASVMQVPIQYVNQNCETRLETRLGWKLLGIPQMYTLAELQQKEFVTFCIFRDYHAETPEEHTMILQHMLGIYGPAFGETQRQITAPVAVKMIEAPAADEGDEFEDLEVVPQPAEQTAGGNGPVQPTPPRQVAETPPASVSQEPHPSPDGGGAAQQVPIPLAESPAPSGSSKAEKIDFLQAVAPLKKALLELRGAEEGAAEYYKLLLEIGGVAHANELVAGPKRSAFYRKLEARVKLLRENPAPKEAAKPFAEALSWARDGYMKLADEPLTERIQEQLKLQHYPEVEDPLAILPVLTQGNHLELVDAAVRLMERKLSMDAEDAAAYRASKGGAR